MNEIHRRTALSALGLAGIAAAAKAGPLNPPTGAVAPTGKAITEAEPRVAVNATNTPGDANWTLKITAPGAYYLTSNISVAPGKGGIQISATDVTLDLNGFSITGSGTSTNLISLNGALINVAIMNGGLRNTQGFGIDASLTGNTRFERLIVNGCGAGGINASSTAFVSDCSCQYNGTGVAGGGGTAATGNGISVGAGSIVQRCIVRSFGRSGISHNGIGMVLDCTVAEAISTANAAIVGANRTIIRGCQVGNCPIGIRVSGGSRVEACVIGECLNYGIVCDGGFGNKVIDNVVTNVGSSVGHAAIRVNTSVNATTIEGNRLEGNYRHIEVASAANFIARNLLAYSGAGGVWTIAAGNAFGPLVVVGALGDISALAGAAHPQANLVY
jgi:hypothetical protein